MISSSPTESLTNLLIRRNSPEPVHEQLTRQLRTLISSGELVPKSRLPGHAQLGKRLSIHRLTVGKAYETLEREGLVVKRRGVGSFVVKTDPDDPVGHSVIARPGASVVLGMLNREALQANPVNMSVVHECMQGMEEYFRNQDISLSILAIPINQTHSQARSWAEKVAKHDGALFIGRGYHNLIRLLAGRDFPCVSCMTGSNEQGEPGSFVSYRRREAFRMMTDHLVLKCQRRRIGFAGTLEENKGQISSKLYGYIESLDSHGLAYDPKLRIDCPLGYDFHRQVWRQQIKDAVEQRAIGDAIVCSGHGIGPVILDVLRQHGIAVPDDVAVVGNDDMVEAEHTDPPLTTLYIPRHEAGSAAAEVLCQRIAEPLADPIEKWIEPSLIVRASSRLNGKVNY